MKPKALTNYIVVASGLGLITAMYWVAADPPKPWILAMTGAGALFGIGVTIYKKRRGLLE